VRTESWLVSYGLLGLTQNGLVPVLMPLVAVDHGTAGLTYAAFSLLGLFAPILGTWADRTGRHRDLLIWGTIGSGILLLLFDAAGFALRIVLAAGAGLGGMATTTAGNVLAIQGHPEPEWDARVALLQRYVSAGQVIGLIAAGLLAHSYPADGFVFAGVALLAAGALAIFSAPPRQPREPAERPAPKPMVGGDAGVSGPHHRGHHFSWQELRAYIAVINRPLRRFLVVWLIAYPAMNGFATLFPVAMIREFGMDPILSSGAYAIGVGGSLLLYAPLGVATHRVGGWRMLGVGFGARLAVLGVLAAAGFAHLPWIGWLMLAGFALIQFVWPALAVAANSLSVRLAPTARGAAGFVTLTAITFATVASACALIAIWLPRRNSPVA
jgi:hypothetical protein